MVKAASRNPRRLDRRQICPEPRPIGSLRYRGLVPSAGRKPRKKPPNQTQIAPTLRLIALLRLSGFRCGIAKKNLARGVRYGATLRTKDLEAGRKRRAMSVISRHEGAGGSPLIRLLYQPQHHQPGNAIVVFPRARFQIVNVASKTDAAKCGNDLAGARRGNTETASFEHRHPHSETCGEPQNSRAESLARVQPITQPYMRPGMAQTSEACSVIKAEIIKGAHRFLGIALGIAADGLQIVFPTWPSSEVDRENVDRMT